MALLQISAVSSPAKAFGAAAPLEMLVIDFCLQNLSQRSDSVDVFGSKQTIMCSVSSGPVGKLSKVTRYRFLVVYQANHLFTAHFVLLARIGVGRCRGTVGPTDLSLLSLLSRTTSEFLSPGLARKHLVAVSVHCTYGMESLETFDTVIN